MVNIQSLIMLVVFVLILTALAPSIISSTASNVFNSTGADNPAGALVNASSGGKAMYGLVELLYPVLAIFGIMAVVGIGMKKK